MAHLVAASEKGELLACGGRSGRRTLFGSDGRADRDESWLDPGTEPAKIRAFFVEPAHTRQGLARAILERSEREAINAGFSAFARMATLPGVPFTSAVGTGRTGHRPRAARGSSDPLRADGQAGADVMLGIHGYGLFMGSGILLNVTPGQDTMFIIGQSLSGGRRAGVAAAVGITLGSVCHTFAAALGLSAILATSALAFSIVKLAGAGYLVFLGVQLLLARPTPIGVVGEATAARQRPAAVMRQGMLTNVLNPKVALFFLAFLPQFVVPTSNTKTLAFLVLGATFITTGFLWCLVVAFAAARLQSFFVRNPSARTLIDRLVGGLFVALGARLAWSR